MVEGVWSPWLAGSGPQMSVVKGAGSSVFGHVINPSDGSGLDPGSEVDSGFLVGLLSPYTVEPRTTQSENLYILS